VECLSQFEVFGGPVPRNGQLVHSLLTCSTTYQDLVVSNIHLQHIACPAAVNDGANLCSFPGDILLLFLSIN
jgi:hypothetical protein